MLPIIALGRGVVGRAGMAYELTTFDLQIHYPPAIVTVPRQAITGVQIFDRHARPGLGQLRLKENLASGSMPAKI